MKWVTSEYDEMRGCNIYHIKHEKLLKFLGFRWQYVEEIDNYEFRMSFLRFGYSPAPMQASNRKLIIPILFMKRDHGIYLGKSERMESYIQGDKSDLKFIHHRVFNIRIF